MSRPEPWQVLSDVILLERRWLRVREQRVRLANGQEIDEFHVLEGPDWAASVALTDNQELVMVRQYRHGIKRDSLELPAGVIEPGEDPLLAAERELREETGYVAQSWHALSWVSTEPARHSVRAHLYVATGARPVLAPSPEATEVIAVELHATKGLERLWESGEICHAVHIGAILLAARRGFFSLD